MKHGPQHIYRFACLCYQKRGAKRYERAEEVHGFDTYEEAVRFADGEYWAGRQDFIEIYENNGGAGVILLRTIGRRG